MDVMEVAGWAALSRVAVLAWAVTANLLIPDHDAEGVRLWQSETFGADSRVLQSFTRWDSAQFLAIAEHGYQEEPQFAFFPGYPILIRAVNQTVLPSDLALPSWPSTPPPSKASVPERLVLSGLLVSNLAFIVATVAMYGLTRAVTDDTTLAKNAARIMCISPANVFLSSVYTESVFAALCFTGMWCWISAEHGSKVRGGLLQIVSVLACTAATIVRSNGAFTAALPLWFAGLAILRVFTSAAVGKGKKEDAKKGRAAEFKFAMPGIAGIATIAVALLKAAVCCAIIWTPVFAFQEYGTERLCGERHERGSPILDGFKRALGNAADAGTSTVSPLASAWFADHSYGVLDSTPVPPSDPAWCSPSKSGTPQTMLYQHIQRKHWNVGFLRYWELKQIPNFLLASPIVLLTAIYVLQYAKIWTTQLVSHQRDGWSKESIDSSKSGFVGPVTRVLAQLVHEQNRGNAGRTGLLSATAMPFMLMWAVLTVWYVLSINVQVTTRLLLAGCPPAIWCLADAFRNWSGRWRHGVLLYFAVFNVVGIAMHVNFLPWT